MIRPRARLADAVAHLARTIRPAEVENHVHTAAGKVQYLTRIDCHVCGAPASPAVERMLDRLLDGPNR